MIVWGGRARIPTFPFTGSRYDPASDAWMPISIGANVPSARFRHTAAWTGRQMVVWGGNDFYGPLNTGGRYDPASDAWVSTSTGANVPGARSSHTAVWTGTKMIVWGGSDAGAVPTSTGGSYDPDSDAWAPTPTEAN